jgi:hypothetical protein
VYIPFAFIVLFETDSSRLGSIYRPNNILTPPIVAIAFTPKQMSITHNVTGARHAIQKLHLILIRTQELRDTTSMRTAYLEK